MKSIEEWFVPAIVWGLEDFLAYVILTTGAIAWVVYVALAWWLLLPGDKNKDDKNED